MKKNFYSIGSVIVLLIAAFVFVLLPAFVGGSSRGTKLPPFGKYDGKSIKYEQGTDFSTNVANYAEMFKNQGQEIDNSSYLYIFSYAFNATVTSMAYKGAVEKSGWMVPDAAVNRTMLPYFQDANGKYSAKIYKQTPESKKVQLRQQVTDSLIYQRYYADCFGSNGTVGKDSLFGLKSASAEIPFLKNMDQEKRAFSLAAFNTTGYPDSEKIAYGKAHAEDFVKYDMSVITTTDEAEAKKILGRLNSNEITFGDAVTEYSEKTYSNGQGKLTSSYAYQLKNVIPADADFKLVTSLAKDTTSDPVKTEKGFSIFHADGAAVQPDFNDSDMVVVVYNYLKSYQKGHIEDYFTTIAKKFSTEAASDGFAAACNQYNIKEIKVPAFPLNYGNVSVLSKIPTDTVKELAGAESNDNFLKTAFSLKKGTLSDPVVLGNNILVLQLNDIENDQSDAGTMTAAFASELSGYDQNSAQAALFNSPKVENNVASVFIKYFMNNDSQKTTN
ncbi:MAG: peptidylprolyl isomerase [Treponema sp.]|jgi:parvulin-like peptidyl-prolyl isomerase|nr:peptidylprolyl isomerase [Treponema sp.]